MSGPPCSPWSVLCSLNIAHATPCRPHHQPDWGLHVEDAALPARFCMGLHAGFFPSTLQYHLHHVQLHHLHALRHGDGLCQLLQWDRCTWQRERTGDKPCWRFPGRRSISPKTEPEGWYRQHKIVIHDIVQASNWFFMSGAGHPSLWIDTLTSPLGPGGDPPSLSTIVITSLIITCEPGAEEGFSGAIARVSPLGSSEVLEANSYTDSSASNAPSLSTVAMALASLGLSGVVEIGEGIASASFATGWPRNQSQVSYMWD